MYIHNSKIIEFGLGNLGVCLIKLVPSELNTIDTKVVPGIAIETYAEYHTVGETVKDQPLTKIAEDVILAFHNVASIRVLKETVDALLKSSELNELNEKEL